MTTMDKFMEVVRAQIPGVQMDLDRPGKGGAGSWWLDARTSKGVVVVEWRPSMGFGVTSLPTEGFGEGPDEFYDTGKEALARLRELLTTGSRTKPADELALKRLRESRGVSQDDLAKLIGVKQGTISKIERKRDPGLSNLGDWVSALGGTLEVKAVFQDRAVTIDVGRPKKTMGISRSKTVARKGRAHRRTH